LGIGKQGRKITPDGHQSRYQTLRSAVVILKLSHLGILYITHSTNVKNYIKNVEIYIKK
jgi:hypothetical protein